MAKAFTFSVESNLNVDKNRSTSSVGGFFKICAPTKIRTPAIVLKGLCPDPAINKHNPDLPENIYGGLEH
jgi:hypothetical protein